MNINITLNGNAMEMPDASTLYDLIELKKWKLVPNYAKIDGELVKEKEYSRILLIDGQNIQIIPFFGGG